MKNQENQWKINGKSWKIWFCYLEIWHCAGRDNTGNTPDVFLDSGTPAAPPHGDMLRRSAQLLLTPENEHFEGSMHLEAKTVERYKVPPKMTSKSPNFRSPGEIRFWFFDSQKIFFYSEILKKRPPPHHPVRLSLWVCRQILEREIIERVDIKTFWRPRGAQKHSEHAQFSFWENRFFKNLRIWKFLFFSRKLYFFNGISMEIL